MTPKQILDSFSETLMQDDRILSAQERALVATLLRHARAATGQDSATQAAVGAVIASAVGETVAQRAFSVLGGNIVKKIVEGGASVDGAQAARDTYVGPNPSPSPGQPEGPGITPPPRATRKAVEGGSVVDATRTARNTYVGPNPSPSPEQPEGPGITPPPRGVYAGPNPSPSPNQPEGPGITPPPRMTVREDLQSSERFSRTLQSTALAERPRLLTAQCVVLDEFLSPQELEELTRFTLSSEASFKASEIISPTVEQGIVNYEHRRSAVLMEVAEYQDLMVARIKSALPQVLEKLGMESFDISGVEAQITASNHGDYFHFHSDNGSAKVSSRYLTFVYFFHREPRQFEGGELRIHDAHLEKDGYVSAGSYQTIAPQQNQIVFFPCELMHEITPVSCPSQLFADSRFTLNGWLRR